MPGRDPNHWLYRFSPAEWIRASINELAQARAAFERRNARAGLAGCRRAAGIALNGVLALTETPDPAWGRTYVEHLAALTKDETAPQTVRDAARHLLETPLPGGDFVVLRTTASNNRTLEAAETVMAHAYALLVKANAV
jgi:HEPN domain-containing protein